jgi:hypothetical protein
MVPADEPDLQFTKNTGTYEAAGPNRRISVKRVNWRTGFSQTSARLRTATG